MLLLFAAAGGAHAQTHRLNEVLELAVKNYPLLRSRQAEVSSAKHDVRAAVSEYIPKIAAQHQYTYGTSNSVTGAFYPNPAVISPSGGIRADNINQATWGSYTSALLEWNVFNFGKLSGNVKAAKAAAGSSEAAYANEVFQHQVRVADAYLVALMTNKLASIQEANLERALRFRQVVSAGVVSGMRAGVDSSLASAEYVKARLVLLESKRIEKAQVLQLAELAGTQPSADFVPDSMQFFTALPLRSDTGAFYPGTNPLLAFYRSRVDASMARSVAVKRSFFPSITLVGALWARGSGVSNDDSFHTSFSDGTKYQVHNYLIGVATRWTLSDFFSTHQRYKSEQYKVIRDEELYNEQALRTQRQLRESDMQYSVALEQAQMAPLQLAAAQHAFQQADARYKSGLSDLPTLLQSMVTLNRAEADLAIAYTNVWRSLLAISASKGDFSIFMNSIQ